MGLRRGLCSAPVARMGPAPLLNALDVGAASEVVAIVRFAVPPSLGGRFAGCPAGWSSAITLPLGVAEIREEQAPATAALAPRSSMAHVPEFGEEKDADLSRSNQSEKNEFEEGTRALSRTSEEHQPPKKTEFQTARSPPLSFRPPHHYTQQKSHWNRCRIECGVRRPYKPTDEKQVG